MKPLGRLLLEARADLLTALVLGLATFGLLAATANDLGITYDEPVYARQAIYAQTWLTDVASRMARGELLAFADATLLQRDWRARDMQPPLLKWAIALIAPLMEPWLPGLAPFRAATAWFAAVMVVATFAAARLTMSRASAVCGALLLLFLPHVFALAHLMSLDIPVAAMTMLTALLLQCAVTRDAWGWWIAAGVSLGLALSAKLNGALIVPACALWIVAHRSSVRPHLFRLLGVCALGALVFFALWPYLWYDPIDHALAYLRFHLRHYPVNVFYLGRVYRYAPWHYPLVMLMVTTPVVALALIGLGGGVLVTGQSPQRAAERFWLLAAALQILAFMNPGTPKYNAVRLFVAAFPFLCVLAARGVETLLELPLARRDQALTLRARGPLFVLLTCLALLAPAGQAAITSHPFGLSYYNQLVFGPQYARRWFEPTYWGDAYFHTLPYLNAHVPRGGAVAVMPDSVVWLFDYYRTLGLLRSDIRAVANVDESDYVVFHLRQSEMPELAHHLWQRGRPARRVQTMGTVVAVVYSRAEADRVAGDGAGTGPKKNPAVR